jgi:membrane-associated phospholipid phosphatase
VEGRDRSPLIFGSSERQQLHERFLAHPARSTLVGAVLLALVCVLAVAIPAQPMAIDRSWSELMRDIQTPVLTDIALVFNAAGRGLTRAVTIAGIGVALFVARRWLALAAFAAVEGITPLISSLIKDLVDRPRPPNELVHPSGASFPSGHAAYAGATCVVLVLVLTTLAQNRRPWWTAAFIAIAAMAWSRTYLQAHWLSDVVAGSLLGIAIALLVFGSAQLTTHIRRRHVRSAESDDAADGGTEVAAA